MPGLNTLLTLGAKAGERVGTALGELGSSVSKGIRAYHSSPHDFERFDLSKIGTGEGAQMYGHGLYFAENPAVSGQGGEYWRQFLGKFQGTPEGEAARELMHSGFDRAKAIDMLERDLRGKRELGLDALNPDYAQTRVALERLRSGNPVGPRTYEVNINAQPEELLNWDKPLQAQPEGVQRLVQENPRLGGSTAIIPTPIGESVYRRLQAMKGDAAPKVLDAYGVPGLKYLDQRSRQLPAEKIAHMQSIEQTLRDVPDLAPETRARMERVVSEIKTEMSKPQTSNYVMWRDDLVDILKKYGIGAAVPAGGALMQPSDERQ